MKVSSRINLFASGIVVAALFMTGMFYSVQPAYAEGEAKQYVQLNAGITLADNLLALKGKTVTIYMTSGQSMTGIVKDVKDNILHLEKISQKEFYDSIIRIDIISAFEARVR